jgi:hypothetical protein
MYISNAGKWGLAPLRSVSPATCYACVDVYGKSRTHRHHLTPHACCVCVDGCVLITGQLANDTRCGPVVNSKEAAIHRRKRRLFAVVDRGANALRRQRMNELLRSNPHSKQHPISAQIAPEVRRSEGRRAHSGDRGCSFQTCPKVSTVVVQSLPSSGRSELYTGASRLAYQAVRKQKPCHASDSTAGHRAACSDV